MRRRRFDVLRLIVGALLSVIVALAGAAAGNRERVTSLFALAEVHTDGRSTITEVIDYEFGTLVWHHGIYRDLPSEPTNVTVSATDAPADVVVEPSPVDSSQWRIRIGSPTSNVTGRHRYIVRYDLDGLTGAGSVSWNAVGLGWSVGFDRVEAHLVASSSLTAVRCEQGTAGSTAPCDVTQAAPGHLVARTTGLGAHRALTLYATTGVPSSAVSVGVPPLVAPTRNGAGVVEIAFVAVLAALVAAAPTSRLIRRTGRDVVAVGGAADVAYPKANAETRLIDHDELASMVTIEFAPPKDIEPAMGGALLNDGVGQNQKVAWLLTQAIAGAVEITQDGGHPTLHHKGLGTPEDGSLVTGLFGGSDEIVLGHYDKSFAAGWQHLTKALTQRYRTQPWWDEASGQRVRRLQIQGALIRAVSVVGVFLAAMAASGWGPVWLVALAAASALGGAGTAVRVRAWELRRHSATGSGAWLRIESFRRFVAESEAQHVEQAASMGLLREYSAWAMALGESKHWAKVVGEAGTVTDSVGVSYAALGLALMSSTASTSTAPSSSSGGGGGAGGGGGGGGGGSW